MNEYTKREKGDIAELRVALRATEKGFICSKPFSTCRYDLIIDDGRKLHRTQVKYANAKPQNSTGSVFFTANNGPRSPKNFSKSEIDAIIAYIPLIDKLVWVKPEVFDGKTAIYIRLEPPKNGQKDVFLAEENIW